MPARNEDVALLGIVVIFGIQRCEITATVRFYKAFLSIRTHRHLLGHREDYNQRTKVSVCPWSRPPIYIEMTTVAQIPRYYCHLDFCKLSEQRDAMIREM